MKKALEAGIKHCSLFEKYLTHLPEMVDFYYKQRTILQVMLAALDDEPEKPEPQGNVVDYKKLEKIIVNLSYCTYGKIIEELKECESQWLKTKPADILLSQKYIENFKYCGLDSKQLYAAILYAKCHGFQCDDTKPLIDPEIKRVYEKWKDIATSLGDRMAREEEFFNCIKAHCERGE